MTDNPLAEVCAALEEAALQIEYLHEKFQETGSGNSVLARLRQALAVTPLIRAAALEEAAKVALEAGSDFDTCNEIAAAIRALVANIEAYPPESELPDWEDLRGRAPDATGDLSSEAFVRKLRDGWDKP